MKLYGELAHWWPLMSPPEGYADEAADVLEWLESVGGPVGSLLELGAGAGHLASHWPVDELVLVDSSPHMQAVSRALNPGRTHVLDDLRTLRMGRVFDAVVLHDAVMYMTSVADFRAAVQTVAAHLQPGGAALFLPDATRESWEPGNAVGGADAEDGSGVRFLEWGSDPDPSDDLVRVDFAVMVRDADGRVQHFHEAHDMGVFAESVWNQALADAGLERVPVPGFVDRPAYLVRRR
jgi:hypothetical protein